jgi:2-keto-4-pentenoate hydratase/2-oxohepta-3-ene-1,7-dioic acid hydratase in catechol pathway
MRFATLLVDGVEQAALGVPGGRWAPLHLLDDGLAGDLLRLIERVPDADFLATLAATAETLPAGELVPADGAVFRPPYRRPRKVWGIGLNYREHAADLSAPHPEQPASFLKGDHTIVGPGDDIVLPRQSRRVTAEAELGVIIGRTARDVPVQDAFDHIFGLCTILDQTAEDILARNPRYLTRSKNFPTFFSFGPEVVTLDELAGYGPDLERLDIATVVNGATVRSNTVANMTHGLRRLISFHSELMPLFPGDIISTGTPGAAVIRLGDLAEARVGPMTPLTNPVVAGPLAFQER